MSGPEETLKRKLLQKAAAAVGIAPVGYKPSEKVAMLERALKSYLGPLWPGETDVLTSIFYPAKLGRITKATKEVENPAWVALGRPVQDSTEPSVITTVNPNYGRWYLSSSRTSEWLRAPENKGRPITEAPGEFRFTFLDGSELAQSGILDHLGLGWMRTEWGNLTAERPNASPYWPPSDPKSGQDAVAVLCARIAGNTDMQDTLNRLADEVGPDAAATTTSEEPPAKIARVADDAVITVTST